MRKVLFCVILSLTILQVTQFFFINIERLTRRFDPSFFGDLYSRSQYVLGPKSQGGIGDDGLYAFAGYYYFFKAGDVSAVNFEHPPLGKYLIGLSIFLFNNENTINIVYLLLLLSGVFTLSFYLFKDNLKAIFATFFLSLDPLILDHVIRSQLDLPFTIFFFFGISFFIFSLKEYKHIYLSFLFLGCAFSTRFFPFFIVLYLFLFLFYFFIKRKKTTHFFVASLLVCVIYLISHISFFVYHPSLLEFIKHKRWMLSWFSGAVYIVGNIWRNIFSGEYIGANGRLTKNENWSVLYPLIVSLSVFPILFQSFRFFQNPKLRIKKEKSIFNKNILAIWGICLLYLTYVTLLTDGVGKFLMPIFPLLAMLASHHILEAVYSIISLWKQPHLTASKRR